MLCVTVYRCTVAGTVYDSRVLPYSPAFKLAPVMAKKNMSSYLLKILLEYNRTKRKLEFCEEIPFARLSMGRHSHHDPESPKIIQGKGHNNGAS